MDNKTNILLVDDRKENLLALGAVLESPGLNILTATSGNEALGLMLEHDLAVVILDVQMPEMDGFEVAELMRKNEKTKYIPIIFVTAFSKDEDYIFKGYETGAVDYLFKPLNPVILKSKVNIFLELEQSRKQIEKQNERLKELSFTDGLTGLYNHRYFQEILNREFAIVRRNRTDLSCFMIDLDYFKDVNDTFGHAFGDFVLRRFARLLKGAVRETDILARYGGEEFVLLLPHTHLDGARVLAEKCRKKAAGYVYENEGYSRRVTISIGIASCHTHQPPGSSDLVSFADQALYRAKAEGRNQVRIYNEEALNNAGALNFSPPDQLLDIKARLKKIQEKTTDAAMASLETLLHHSNLDLHLDQSFNFDQERSGRIIRILDLMSQRLGLPRLHQQIFKRAAKLHDMLMLLLGDETIHKEGTPGMEEQIDIEDHPIMLEELARTFDIFADERAILRYHHENHDGSGYPEGLRGTQVPMGARLLSLVHAFVNMTSLQNSKPLLPPQQVIDQLVKEAGHQFDPLLVGHLLGLIEENKLLPVSKKQIRAAKEEI
ncbi:MAG: diguanylate cyclase [Candidatus Aminicenantes bacterium]|nr:MAG: diguanylate cyclase [Candidatus Aminicenantes bacterium]